MPAGCGLGQIKSLIHEGGWEEGEREWESRRDAEEEAEMDGDGCIRRGVEGSGKMKVWVKERIENGN